MAFCVTCHKTVAPEEGNIWSLCDASSFQINRHLPPDKQICKDAGQDRCRVRWMEGVDQKSLGRAAWLPKRRGTQICSRSHHYMFRGTSLSTLLSFCCAANLFLPCTLQKQGGRKACCQRPASGGPGVWAPRGRVQQHWAL